MDTHTLEDWGMDQTKWDGIKLGAFRNSGYYGIGTTVLKSGICKYYRRKEWAKWEWCVVEMFLMGLKSKGIMTNLLNRLKILVMEEVVCSEIGAISKGVECLEEVEKNENVEKKLEGLLKFCGLMVGLKRGRLVSYMNNWWKCKDKKYELDGVVLEKVKKYEKKGDSEELLKLGELFIGFLESGDWNVFGVGQIVYMMDGKFGNRFRRKDGFYLLVEILEDFYGPDEKMKKIWEFGKTMMFRKQMNERMAFGVWMVMMGWKRSELDLEDKETMEFIDGQIGDYMRSRTGLTIDEDYVVKDYHVNKKHGLKKFGEVGSLVIEEDLSLLGEKGEEMRKLYVDVKAGAEVVKKKKKIVKKKKVVEEGGGKGEVGEKVEEGGGGKEEVVEEKDLDLVDWSEFEDVKVLEDGVCGLKVCCIRAKWNGKGVVLKEMKKSFRRGRDYMIVDQLKKRFGVKDLGMKRIRSNMGLEVKDKKKKTFVGNWKWGEREVVYCVMDDFENLGDLGKNKRFLEREEVFMDSLKIRLFDGLFRSSDNILRNILVNSDGVVLSIDEGDIYGKRKLVFNKNDWFCKSENVEKTKKMINEILSGWDLVSLKEEVGKEMVRWGFGEMVEEMRSRFVGYREIIMSEF